MLLSTPLSLDDQLVLILSKQQSATAKQLQTELKKRVGSFTIQGIYKELNKLQHAGVILRQAGRYSLSLSWILNLSELVDEMFYTQTRSQTESAILPETDQKKTFVFSRLSHLDDFWIHALLIILQNSQSKLVYQWLPHPWFHLIHSHKSWPLFNALKLGGFRVNSIIGGDSYLDLYSKSITKKGVYEYFYSPGPFHNERNKYYSVSDSYILTVSMDKSTTDSLEELYRRVKSSRDINSLAALSTLNAPAKITVTIDNRSSSIKRIRNKFINYFA